MFRVAGGQQQAQKRNLPDDYNGELREVPLFHSASEAMLLNMGDKGVQPMYAFPQMSGSGLTGGQANCFGMGTYFATTANAWAGHMQGTMDKEHGVRCMGIFAHQRLFGHFNNDSTLCEPKHDDVCTNIKCDYTFGGYCAANPDVAVTYQADNPLMLCYMHIQPM